MVARSFKVVALVALAVVASSATTDAARSGKELLSKRSLSAILKRAPQGAILPSCDNANNRGRPNFGPTSRTSIDRNASAIGVSNSAGGAENDARCRTTAICIQAGFEQVVDFEITVAGELNGEFSANGVGECS